MDAKVQLQYMLQAAKLTTGKKEVKPDAITQFMEVVENKNEEKGAVIPWYLEHVEFNKHESMPDCINPNVHHRHMFNLLDQHGHKKKKYKPIITSIFEISPEGITYDKPNQPEQVADNNEGDDDGEDEDHIPTIHLPLPIIEQQENSDDGASNDNASNDDEEVEEVEEEDTIPDLTRASMLPNVTPGEVKDIISDEKFWDDYITPLGWTDVDESKRTKAYVINIVSTNRKKAELRAAITELTRDIRTALENQQDFARLTNETKNNILAHIVAKGRDFYFTICEAPDIALYLIDKYQPLWTYLA